MDKKSNTETNLVVGSGACILNIDVVVCFLFVWLTASGSFDHYSNRAAKQRNAVVDTTTPIDSLSIDSLMHGSIGRIWRGDTLGCGGQRYEIMLQIMEGRSKLRGVDRAGIVALLGEPDIPGHGVFQYFYAQGIQCDFVKEGRSIDSAESPRLYIGFDSVGRCEVVLSIIP